MNHRKTPLRVPIMAILAALFAAFLFGGVSRADETQSAAEAQSSSGIVAEAQSSGVATTVADTSNETQSSSGVAGEAQSSSTANTEQSSSGSSVATAATSDDKPASCNPSNISPEEIQENFVTSDGSPEVTAYESVQFSVALTLKQGHCAGDSITISVPSELGTDGSFEPIPMMTPEGVIIGYATYSADHTVVIRLTDQVEVPGRKNFRASAWWRVHMSSVLVPGETRELEWNIGGIIRRTPITVGTCPGCSSLGAGPSKWGTASSLKPWDLTVTVVTPTAGYDNQTFVITDQATSSGQDFACPDPTIGQAGVYSSAGPWGQPIYTRFIDATIESCSSEKVVFKIVLNKGEKARADILVNVSPEDRGPWTDEVEIVSQEKTWTVGAKVVRKESGGNAGFDPTNPPTPTPSPTPTPVTPTPAPSASPSPSPSAPSPSVTPTPTPSASPSPTPTPSTTPSATSSTTPAPVPTPSAPTPRQRQLPVTGAAGGAVASAVALAAIGGLALRARRHQAARR